MTTTPSRRAVLRSDMSCNLGFLESKSSWIRDLLSPVRDSQRPAPGERTPPALDPVNRKVFHDSSTHYDAGVLDRRFRLLCGNENRRSQLRGSTGSSCLRLLHSWARIIHKSIGTDLRTQASHMPGGIVGASGLVAGATEPDRPSPEQPPCRLGVLDATTRRPAAAGACVDRAARGPHSVAVHGLSPAIVGTCRLAQHEVLMLIDDEMMICPHAPRAQVRTPELGPTQPRTGRAHNERLTPPRTPTPSLLATVSHVPLRDNRHVAQHPVTPSSV